MTSLRNLILISALLAVTTPALAEDAHHPVVDPAATVFDPVFQPEMMGSGMMSPGMMGMMGMMKSMSAMMDPVHMEGRLAFLQTELKITDAQQSLWETFADVARKTTHDQQAIMQKMQMGMMSNQMPAHGNLLRQMDRHEQMMSLRLDQLRRMKAALAPLYEALDDAQKHTADDLLMPYGMGAM